MWEQVVERGTQGHGVDHEVDIIREFEPDDLQQVPGVVGSDGEHLGWVGLGFEIDDGEGMVEGVENGSIVWSGWPDLNRRPLDPQ